MLTGNNIASHGGALSPWRDLSSYVTQCRLASRLTVVRVALETVRNYVS